MCQQKSQKFFRCNHCGNLVSLINDGGVPMICCGEPMEELLANTVDATVEKHIPEVSIKDGLVHVKVGSVVHPMTDEHHIEFIYLQTENSGQRKHLKVGSEAAATFAVMEDRPLAVFAYCNLHGLWRADVPCGSSSETMCSEEEQPDETICSAEFAQGCMTQCKRITK